MTKPLTVEQLRCLELSAIIREGLEGVEFDMAAAGRKDKPRGCIMGFACAKYSPDFWDEWGGLSSEAGRLLGVFGEQQNQLFFPEDYDGPSYSDITPAMAADTLDRLAMTKKVVWE